MTDPEMPFHGRIPQSHDLHIPADKEVTLLLLPGSQDTATMPNRKDIRHRAKRRCQLSLPGRLIPSPDPNTPLGWKFVSRIRLAWTHSTR